MAWSFLRLPGYLFISKTSAAKRGRMMGFYHSISLIGSVGGTLIGGILLDFWGFRKAVLALACISAMGVPLALMIKESKGSLYGTSKNNIISLLSNKVMFSIGLTSMMNHLIIGGVIASTLPLYLKELIGEYVRIFGMIIGIATLSGFLASLRLLSWIIISPLTGLMLDIVGRYITLVISSCALLLSLALLCLSLSMIVMIVLPFIFLFSAALGTVLDTEISDEIALRSEDREYAISLYTNWIDAGLAIGPLLAYQLRTSMSFQSEYLWATLVFLLTIIQHLSVMRRRS
ncbi:MAG: hypothetical protein DRZ82_04790 [Thermoprotei archaeon]|nr:MAG: hypothetical protein DRZ82_04790 [Thermoprotei archaeon]